MQILIVDDDQNIIDNLTFSLEKQGYKVRSAKSGSEAQALIQKHHFEIAFLDYALPDTNGIALMAEIKKQKPELICIFVTGSSDIGIAVEAVQKGAYDFIEKPFELDRIKVTLDKAKRELLQKQKINYLEKTIDEAKYDPIIGSHRSLKEILAILKKIASAQTFTTLIQGESGTGKELAAKYLHAQSTRKNQPFIAINCAAIPADLLESELFGHEKGSFSGAVETKIGLFEMASGGILFLDEIGDMPLEMQVKLLRALET
jgi:DNA-binding NtrC family response regulator